MKTLRIFLFTLFLVILLGLGIVMSIPALVSTERGKDTLIQLVNRYIPGELQVEALDLHWMKASQVKGLKLHDETGKKILSIESLKIQNSLWKLVSSSYPRPLVDLHHLDALVIADETGSTNIERALREQEKPLQNTLEPINISQADIVSEIDPEWKTLKIQATGKATQGNLVGSFKVDGEIGTEIHLKIAAESMPVMLLDQIAALKNKALSGLMVKLLGPRVDVELEQDGTEFHVLAQSPQASLKAEGRLKDKLVEITQPSVLKVECTKALTDALRQTFNLPIPNFKNSVFVQLNLAKLKASLDGERLEGEFTTLFQEESTPLKVTLEGQLAQDTLTATGDVNFQNMKIQGLEILAKGIQNKLFLSGQLKAKEIVVPPLKLTLVTLPWQYDLKSRMVNLNFETSLFEDNSPLGSLKGDIKGTTDKNEYRFSLLGSAIPLSRVLPNSTDQAQVDLKGQINALGQGHVDYLLSSPEFSVEGAVDIEGFKNIKSPEKPTTVKASISQERLSRLAGTNIKLDRPIDMVVSVNSFFLKEPLTTSQIDLKYHINPFKIKLETERTFHSLEAIDGVIKSSNLAEQIAFTLTEKQGGGHLNGNGEIQNAFNKQNLSANVELKGTNFPVPVLTAFIDTDGTLTPKALALLGPTLNTEIRASLKNMAGPVSLQLQGQNAKVDLQGFVQNQGFYLAKPLTMEVKITPEIGQKVLEPLIPLLSSALRADEPITLTVDSNNFFVPLDNISLTGINMPSAELNLGKMYFSNQGRLADLISLLKANSEPEFSVWFTPIYFSLQGGNFSMARADFLIRDRFPAATWGSIDFNQQYVSMAVGLTGKSLHQAFGVIGMPKSYMLVMPFRGPLSSPKLDTAQVTAKISGLLAMVAGGPQGMLVGGLIELATGAIGEKVPDPSTKPLPWEVDAPETADADSKPTKTPKPIKEAGKFLKDLFGG